MFNQPKVLIMKCNEYCCNQRCNQGRTCVRESHEWRKKFGVQALAISIVSIAAAIVVYLDLFVWRA
jgi:hypothetical protein